MKKRTFSNSFTAAVTTLLTASSAKAAMQYITGSPLSATASGSSSLQTTNWDIDNNGINDGRLRAFATMYSGPSGHAYISNISNRMKFAQQGAFIEPVGSNGVVGPTNYVFGPALHFIFLNNNNFNKAQFLYIPQVNGLIGFSFLRSGNTHYGWADISYSGFGLNGTLITINSWAWNDTPDAPAPVNSVPEPETYALGLAGLALGAAGLRRWRKTRYLP